MLVALKNGDIVVFNQIRIDDFVENIHQQIHKVRISIGEILRDEGKLTNGDVAKILQEQKESSFTKKFGEIAIEDHLITEEDIEESIKKQKEHYMSQDKKTQKVDSIIKVKASRINYLVDTIGELLIAENQLDEKDKNVVQLRKITKEIQAAAMQLRTVKVKNLFINMKRVVRDMAMKLKKNVVTETIGEELEIDRNLVEILDEPLIHILRNSVHHGIEEEKERIEKNKNKIAKIILKAERRGNNIVISAKDDGKGLDRDRILEKAISRNLITREKAKTLSKNEIFDLVFVSGLSTAKEVDRVSGRGVGMGIVKSAVTSSRGNVEIRSEKDQFTEITLIFPLSMAIIDGMIVKTEDTHFVIPATNIIESLKIEKNMIYTIENKTSVIDLRQEIIPVIQLRDFFDIQNTFNQVETHNHVETHGYASLRADARLLAVIVENREKKFAFVVNEIIAKKEIVIKPLNNKFKKLKGISSGTILQGGKIGFIIDVEEIVSTT